MNNNTMNNNEVSIQVYVNGTPVLVSAKNKFHAVNRAKKQNPNARVSFEPPVSRAPRRLVRISTTTRANGRSFSVAIYSDGTTADLD